MHDTLKMYIYDDIISYLVEITNYPLKKIAQLRRRYCNSRPVLAHRPDEYVYEGQKRNQCAQRQLALGDPIRADQ